MFILEYKQYIFNDNLYGEKVLEMSENSTLLNCQFE